jgi:hypothetical protein
MNLEWKLQSWRPRIMNSGINSTVSGFFSHSWTPFFIIHLYIYGRCDDGSLWRGQQRSRASTTAFCCHTRAAACCWAAADLVAARVMAMAEWAAAMSSRAGRERAESSSGSQALGGGVHGCVGGKQGDGSSGGIRGGRIWGGGDRIRLACDGSSWGCGGGGGIRVGLIPSKMWKMVTIYCLGFQVHVYIYIYI